MTRLSNLWGSLKEKARGIAPSQHTLNTFRAGAYGALAGVTATIAVGLVAIDILRGTQNPLLNLIRLNGAAGPGVVRNYVMFNTTEYGSGRVVTGTQYSASDNPKIEEQWCYYEDADAGDGRAARLNLAHVKGREQLKVTDFTMGDVAPFDLTIDEAEALVGFHCQFQ
ncbi:hypothetical protein VK792_19480 [Mesobacterium sp. TK19101]|uniref:Uncharacterized protein n=1 Tax=Mesobacterium hydrothermale TaxID=3111907 RepID=A0ABU6HNP6_9RHOB|nr:hypothetical protein [Mesobacterium sp. TK19101]MEC3863466.1 hypothetical protein [Mesobacterium sp. TK19101]